MRTIWKRAISFSPVNIPVSHFPAAEQKDVKFRYLHQKCQAPVQYKRACTACGQEVAQEEIVHGYEYDPGRYLIINENDPEQPARKRRPKATG